ncbi:MAG: hypothetical protein ABIE70_07070 [bacterium]
MRIFMACLCVAGAAYGQTTTNPDISAVGDFRVFSHNDESRANEVEELNIGDPEFELNIGGYLNPYSRADAVIGWHGEHSAEIEEIYATVERGLPLDAGLRVGKYLLEFGRLNPVHPHAYSFIKRPLPHEAFFGEEGLADVAIRPSFLLPTGDTYTELMFAVLKGDALTGHGHEYVHEEEGEEEHEDVHGSEEESKLGLGFFGRLTSSFALNESTELSFGASAVRAVHEMHEHEHEEIGELWAWLVGGDVKYKYRPNRNTALQIEVETIVRQAEQAEGMGNLSSLGWYAYLDYHFRQQYNIGGIYEYTKLEEPHEHEGEEPEVHQVDTWRAGLFVGWAPIEETSLVRLAGHWTKPDEGEGFWELTMQFVVSLGPHKPHNF